MDGERCQRAGCTGTIEDDYCNVCGMAQLKSSDILSDRDALNRIATARSSSVTTGTGSSPLTNRSKGSRRSSKSTNRSSRRLLGAGLVSVPELPSTEPEKAIIPDPKVPENKRFCSKCDNPLRREKGFCSKCGQKYSFIPTLNPGDLVVGQYEVKGAIAYGGLGWIYLGFDKVLSRYVVLKGLLNSEDASSAAVAVAERQFLAAVKHPNIVGIYNFVNHDSEGFIVMEYVGGQTLKEIRKNRGPLPIGEAIAYIHRILSAFSYLHTSGFVYCDFKPDNVMLEGSDVKLIDLGGVRRLDDPDGDIYGTVGYSAPEAGSGPTVVSDLYTIGRTLAVLLTNIKGFNKENLYSLPSPQEEPLFAEQESLYRFLIKATANNPDERFQSAEEMADQLLGVLREVVAISTNIPRPSPSNLFSPDNLALTGSNDLSATQADYQQLPLPTIDLSDTAINAILNANAIIDPIKRSVSLEFVVKQYPNSSEALLRLANSLIESGMYDDAEKTLAQAETKDPWDWRVMWFRGRLFMAQGRAKEAQKAFDQVYFDLPGELPPKLALALAAEAAQNYDLAIKMYDLVSRTDPSYVSATFGLARCLSAKKERSRAVSVLERIPQSSSLFARSRVEITRTLISQESGFPSDKDLQTAANAIESLSLEGLEKYRLTKQILETALNLLTSRVITPTPKLKILGQSLREEDIRKGIEKALRDMAHLTTGDEKIRLVDEANKIRPRTWI